MEYLIEGQSCNGPIPVCTARLYDKVSKNDERAAHQEEATTWVDPRITTASEEDGMDDWGHDGGSGWT